MYPNSSRSGRPPFPPKHQQTNFCNKLPPNTPPTHLPHQQIVAAQFNFRNAAALLSENVVALPAVTLQPTTYGDCSPVHMSDAPRSFRGRNSGCLPCMLQNNPCIYKQLGGGFGSSTTSGFNFSNPGITASAGLTFGVSNPASAGFGTGGQLLQLKKPPAGNKRGKR